MPGKKETTRALFKRLLPNYVLSDRLADKMTEWITYKTERKEPYKEQGMKSLLRQIENDSLKYGDQAVCTLNETGQSVACERVEELAEMPKYKRTDAEQSGAV